MTELQQFCILARTQKSRACAALIQQVLSHRKIYVFGELLEQLSVQSLKDTEFSNAFNSLELFAYGTLADYLKNKEQYIELSEAQLTKLKHLTLVSLAANDKVISYETMRRELDVQSARALEDLVIEAMYSGLLSGKLDPAHGVLRVKSAIARDVKPEDIAGLIEILTAWRENIAGLAASVRESSGTMGRQRQAGEEEHKAVQELVEQRKKEIQTAVESGEPLDEALRALTGEDGPAAKHGKSGGGGANRVEGHMSGKPRPGSSGTRPSSSKHPRHQASMGSAAMGRR